MEDPHQPLDSRPCSLCRQQPAAADSHIYPEALCTDVLEDNRDVLHAIPIDTEEFEKRCRTGPKTKGILCHGCEHRFHVYDTWLVEALRTVPRAVTRDLQHLPGADAATLKLGFMHVLWRAFVASQLGVFGYVTLPPGRDGRLRELLLADEPGGVEDFPVILAHYNDDPEGMHGLLGAPLLWLWKPNRARIVELPLSRWRVLITTSASGVPRSVPDVALQPGRAVAVLRGSSFRDSPLFKHALQVTRAREQSPPSRARRSPRAEGR